MKSKYSQTHNRSKPKAKTKAKRLSPVRANDDDEYDDEEISEPKGLSPRLASWVLLTIGLGTLGIAACGPTDLRKALTDVRNQPVDDGVQVADRDPKPLDPKDVAIMVDQAARVTGALNDSIPSELKVDVRTPSEVDRPDDGRGRLDVRPQGIRDGNNQVSFEPNNERAAITANQNKIESQKSQSLPVAPIQTGGFVQVGTFSSKERAASLAELALEKGYNVKMRIEPLERGGKILYRLKLGPVRNANEAKALCGALKIEDDWCVRSALS
jgi:cell division septation protein DedD